MTIRILVVDDERDLADNLASGLNILGYQTSTAYDGIEAVLSTIENEWDALLMDIQMPRLDGISALKIIRRIKPDLPIIMFSGQADQGDIMRSTRLGAHSCLPKPIRTDHLYKILDLVFNKKTT